MLSDRQKLILKAIVDEYIKTAEPVGSKVLTEKPYLNFSSATLRYEMALLEDQGYLEKTHTSSGRIPSHLGYKYYVENLITRDYDVLSSFDLIDQVFKEYQNRKDVVVENAINLLSNLTNYTAMLLGPDLSRSKVKKLELISINETECIIIIVTNLGHIQSQKISLSNKNEIDELSKIINYLDDILNDLPLKEVENILNEEMSLSKIKHFISYQNTIVDTFVKAFNKFANENFYLAGMSKVFEQPEFRDVEKLQNLINIMGNRNILKLISANDSSLSVRIGRENTISYLKDCTVISIPYRINEDEKGTIAVIGPTRMDYSRVIPLVEYIANNMSKLYEEEGEKDE